jgi:hypothetical protein
MYPCGSLLDRHGAGAGQQPHRRHTREVVGKIAPGAGDPSAGRIGGMETHRGCLVHQRLAARPEQVVRIAEQMIERRFGVLQSTHAAIDEPRQFTWHQRLGQRQRVPFVVALLQQLRVGARQVDDQLVAQRADAAFRTEHDDLHLADPPCCFAAIRPSRSRTG